MKALAPVPHLFRDRHGCAAHAWSRVPTDAYRLVTLSDGPAAQRDVLVKKRADGTAELFLLPTPEPMQKSFALPALGAREPPPLPFVKNFADLEARTRAVKQATPAPAPAVQPWTSANKPTQIAHLTRPDGHTTYVGLHMRPGPELKAQTVADPHATDDGTVLMRNARPMPMTAAERNLNRGYAVTSPTDLPSLALGTNAEEAKRQSLVHPDFRMIDEAGRPDRLARLDMKAVRGGLIDSDLPDTYSSGAKYMGIGPDGHVLHIAAGEHAAMQAQMQAKVPQRRTSYAYGTHTDHETGDYLDRGHADDFLAHAVYNPAWVTYRRGPNGTTWMYRHVYPRGAGANSQIAHDAPGGLTYVAEKIDHPDDPTGSHWNIFDVITNQATRKKYRTQADYAARSHYLAEDNRGTQYQRATDYPGQRDRTTVRYGYINTPAAPKPNP